MAARITPRSTPGLDHVLIGALRRRGVNPLLATQWMEGGELVLLVDGLNETNHETGRLVTRLEEFSRKYEMCGLVAVARHLPARRQGSGIVRWAMPNLPKRVVARQLSASPSYAHMSVDDRRTVEGVCANPLLLSMLTEGSDDLVPDGAPRTAWDVRQAIIEKAVRRRLAWPAPVPPNEEARFACWLARTMGSTSLGSTLELRTVTWSMLQPGVQNRTWALSLFLLGVPVFLALSTVGWALGLGVAAIGASLLDMAVLYVAATLSSSGLRFVTHREIVHRRRWSGTQLVALGRLSVQQISQRLEVGLLLGVPVGIFFSLLATTVREQLVGEPWLMWLAMATIPLLVLLFGALIGGLLAGAIVGVAFGPAGSSADALIGGLVAGGTGSLFFATVDLGDISTPPHISEDKQVSRTIWRSAWQLARFDVAVWSLFGAFYGSANWIAHGRSVEWAYHGFATGASGAVLFGSIALVSPLSSYAIADFGLRRSRLLTRSSLNGMLARLIEMRILVPGGTGAAFRFAHPLIAEFLASCVGAPAPGARPPTLEGPGQGRGQGRGRGTQVSRR